MRMSTRVHRILVAVLIFWIAAGVAPAQPVISTPVNQASFIPPGLPLYGIAQGSMFAIFGLRMGPDELVIVSAFPVPTELAGTSAQVRVGGVTVDCLMVFTSAGQVAVILPSDTPTGEGTITLTFNGERSNSARILVVENAAGMFALRQDGRGPGIFTDTNFAVNTITNAFAPGSVAIAWLTGLGARSTDDRPVPQDLKDALGLQVKVGGQEARVLYAGPSGCCAGVDQVAFEIPAGPEGCFVPVVMQIRESVSNFVSLAVSSSGTTCSDEQGFLSSELDQMEDQGSLTQSLVTLSTAFLNRVEVGVGQAAGALFPRPVSQNQTQALSAATATFQRVTFRNCPLTGFPFATNTCTALFANRPDNPFAPAPLPATGDVEIQFPSSGTSGVLSDITEPAYLALLQPGALTDGFYRVTDMNADLTIDGQQTLLPRAFEGPGAHFAAGLQQNFGPGSSVDSWFSAWNGYYAGTAAPPTTFHLDGSTTLPEGTILEISGQVNIDPENNFSVCFLCSFDVDGAGEYSVPPETFANFPVGTGPLTGMLGVRLFPKNTARFTGNGPIIDHWMTFDQVVWIRQFIEPAPSGNFAAMATGDQVVPPTGSQSSANCRLAANENGISGACSYNLADVTGVSLNLGASGESGSRFFFTQPEPASVIEFVAGVNDFDPPTPINTVLDALQNGTAYVLLHSTAFPNGEVRGQIGPE